LRSLLMGLERLPLRRGFVRMAGFKSRRLWQLGGNTFEDFFAILSREIQTISALSNLTPYVADLRSALQEAEDYVAEFSKWLQKPKDVREMRSAWSTYMLVRHLRCLQFTLTQACAITLQALNDEWAQETRSVWDAECMALDKNKCEDMGLPLPVQLAEELVCLFYFNFISSVFTRMRALVLAIAGLYVFVLLSFSSYPFEPTSSFHTAMIFLLIFITAAVAYVSGQAHKDATISRITATEVGKLGFDFWLRLLATMGVPLLSLLAAKFPEIGGFLFSWLQPATQAFK
jgi:hypothetical protein